VVKAHQLRPWWLAARLPSLPASIGPVLVGSALAVREGVFSLPVFLATLSAAVLLQIGANYANDVFDYLKGADRQRLGPLRVTQSGLLTPRQMLIGTAVVFALAALIGAYLVAVGGWPILVVGTLAIICAIAYTAGPFPLAYHGLGDLFAFLFFGVVAVMGTAYLQLGKLTWLAFAASLSNACLATCIIIVNNLRDIDTDRLAHKRTLAVRIGDRLTRVEYTALMIAAYLVPSLLLITMMPGRWGLALPLASAPAAIALVRDLWRTPRSPALNPILGRTARLNLLFSVLFAAGLVLS
jgi:1,4-dihydroxy-2-naphthoate octaprenyltransferase